MSVIKVRIPNFEPRPYQIPVMDYLDNGGKRAVCVWHRRGGKDLVGGHQACKAMHQRVGSYWHIFPTERQARKAIWTGFTKQGERIMEQIFPRAIRKSPREWTPSGEMVVELTCGSVWRLMGSDRMEIVGAGPAGVVFSEYSVAKPKTWDLVRPMLRENDGWALFLFTPRGHNHGKDIYDVAGQEPGWFRQLLTIFDTRAYDPERTLAEERTSGMPEALIRQEYLCDWTAALVGSIWGDLVETLEKAEATSRVFDTEPRPVFTSWDLGRSDDTSIWFWQVYRDAEERLAIDVLDFYTSHGKGLEHYFAEVEGRAQRHGWNIHKHWLPHDARQHTLAAKASILSQCIERWGPGQVAIGPELSLLDGIQAARWVLQQNIRFHPRCEVDSGIEALKTYRWTWDEERAVFSQTPFHDWASNPADAFRGLACVLRVTEEFMREAPKPPEKPAAVPMHRAFNLEDLYRDRDISRRRRRL